MKSGDKVKVTIIINAKLETELEEVTSEQLVDFIYTDDAFDLKSVIMGWIGERPSNSRLDDINTALTYDTTDVNVEKIE